MKAHKISWSESMRRVAIIGKTLVFILFVATLSISCQRIPGLSPGSSEHTLAFPAISRPGDPSQDAYPSPDDGLSQYYGTPPLASLHVGGSEQIAVLASSCWMQPNIDGTAAEICSEDRDILTPQIFLPADMHLQGRLKLNLPLAPSAVSVYVMPVSPQEILEPPSEGKIRWPTKDGQNTALKNEVDQEIQLDLSPGLNVLYVHAQWEGLGSAGYGFIVDAVAQ